MKNLIVGNWKMNGSHHLLQSFLANETIGQNNMSEVVLCPPSLFLAECAHKSQAMQFGAQDCASTQKGAYTGEISAQMLAEIGVRYTLVGHSERRRYHGETADQCAAKARTAQQAGLTPIFCIGETRVERDAEITDEVLINQLEPLLVHGVDFQNLVICYEPVWCVGTGIIAEPEMLQTTLYNLRGWLVGKIGLKNANQLRMIYGGSITDENAHDILALEPIKGLLVGGASLNLEKFAAIAAAA